MRTHAHTHKQQAGMLHGTHAHLHTQRPHACNSCISRPGVDCGRANKNRRPNMNNAIFDPSTRKPSGNKYTLCFPVPAQSFDSSMLPLEMSALEVSRIERRTQGAIRSFGTIGGGAPGSILTISTLRCSEPVGVRPPPPQTFQAPGAELSNEPRRNPQRSCSSPEAPMGVQAREGAACVLCAQGGSQQLRTKLLGNLPLRIVRDTMPRVYR